MTNRIELSKAGPNQVIGVERVVPSAPGNNRETLKATLNHIQAHAQNKDLVAVKAESDRILRFPDKFSSKEPDPDEPNPRGIHLQGHGIPGKMYLNDNSKRIRVVTGDVVAEVMMRIWDSPRIGNSREKTSALFFRASLSHEKGDLKDAAWCYRNALRILREYPWLDPQGTFELVTLFELAKILDETHVTVDAEFFYLQATRVAQRTFGRNNENIYKFINCLGVLYESLGLLQDAMGMYQRSMAGRLLLLGDAHYDSAMSTQELATVHMRLDDFESARVLYEKALPGFERSQGPTGQFAMNVSANLCEVYRKLGRLQELKYLSDRMIPRAAASLGPAHIITGAAVRRYIEVFGLQNLPEEVSRLIEYYKQSYAYDRNEVARWSLVPLGGYGG